MASVGPLEPFDVRLPRLLEAHGYATAIVTDHYHYWEAGDRQRLHPVVRERGADPRSRDRRLAAARAGGGSLPPWVQTIDTWRPGLGHRYFSNVAHFRDDRDYFPAGHHRRRRWLAYRPTDRPFFLQVSRSTSTSRSIRPSPTPRCMATGRRGIASPSGRPIRTPARLADFLGATTRRSWASCGRNTRAKVTMVDHWFGELPLPSTAGLWDDTIVIVTTDHGHDLGERRAYGKQFPHFDSHANIPLSLASRHRGDGRTVTG